MPDEAKIIMKFDSLNEHQTKAIMQAYREYVWRKAECDCEIKAMRDELNIWKSGELEQEAESRQTKRNMAYTSSAKGGKATSKTEKAAFSAERILLHYRKKIAELYQEKKQIEIFLRLVDEVMEALPPEEKWLMIEHYRKGRKMAHLASGYEMNGDGRDRIALWHLERKARRSMSRALAEKAALEHLKMLFARTLPR